MTRFRQRIGESGCELLLALTMKPGVRSGAVRERDMARVTADTTVQEKAVAFPADGKLPGQSRERLVKMARRHGAGLRQSCKRLGPKTLPRAARYGHARQMKRMAREVGRLRTCLGRTVRDIRRRTDGDAALAAVFADELAMAERLLAQGRKGKGKLYSLHAPEVECIAKGKARTRCEFGVKASIVAANRSNFAVGGMAMPGNPHDGHTLARALERARRVTGKAIEEAFAGRGYRGHGIGDVAVYIRGRGAAWARGA